MKCKLSKDKYWEKNQKGSRPFMSMKLSNESFNLVSFLGPLGEVPGKRISTKAGLLEDFFAA